MSLARARPAVWADARGNFHMIAHRYDYRDGWPPNPNQTMPVLVSGHGYSADGVEWTSGVTDCTAFTPHPCRRPGGRRATPRAAPGQLGRGGACASSGHDIRHSQ